ncbi:hypothetical protein SUGI_0900830 [Cryptomeria japonica]|uniref:uncharacterized protein LOC131047069 isoform X1 n=2 Tax=Cryptomeria japonica TaxID=3369 RepID=UPI0024147B10|nr:uncharacterized protein LOC131047069 isoform X1 [Cryptomeria japonica]GLJ43362.1 hypothetical protein SUGI_0900830 [Cryptomeria japonica]
MAMATAMILPVQSSFFSNLSSVRQNLMGRSTLSSKRLVPRVKIVAEAESEQKKKGEDESFSPFKFVTDNPSSRNAIQLPVRPAEDGFVGEMISRIENKGRDYGSYVKAGNFKWFVRETGSSDTKLGTIVFIHGAPTQSFSYRVVMAQMADAGYHCYAPDWLGFGFSQKPQPRFDFAYTEEAFHEEFEKLLIELGIDTPFIMVTQGFLMGSYGLTWALKNPSKIEKVAILNSPLTSSAPVPGLFKKLQFPLLGEFTCQNAIMAERFIEGGSPYVLKNEKADVYRLPYLSSSGPGFAILEAARKAPFKDLSSRISNGFSSGRWDIPILVAWGMADKYLAPVEAETFKQNNVSIVTVNLLEGAGHLPQEDWPEKVVDSVKRFLK